MKHTAEINNNVIEKIWRDEKNTSEENTCIELGNFRSDGGGGVCVCVYKAQGNDNHGEQ